MGGDDADIADDRRVGAVDPCARVAGLRRYACRRCGHRLDWAAKLRVSPMYGTKGAEGVTRMSGMDTSIAYDVVLLPDTDRAVAYRKRAADGGCSLMGVTVAAFGAWVRRIYGSCTAMAGRSSRVLSAKRCCALRASRPVGGASLLAGAGDAGAIGLDRVASACVAAGVGLPGFDAAVRDRRACRRALARLRA